MAISNSLQRLLGTSLSARRRISQMPRSFLYALAEAPRVRAAQVARPRRRKLSVAAVRLVGRHGVAIASQQFFHCPDAAWVTAGFAIDLGVLARDVRAAGTFALAAAMAQP